MAVVREVKGGHVAGTFSTVPSGIILHGSRSGRPQSLFNEYVGTANWAASGSHDLGWNATVGDNRYCVHMTGRQWGHHAREHSRSYLSVEFAQPTVNDAITDGQVQAFVAWWRAEVLPIWPTLTAERVAMPAHSEMPAGKRDGKSDTYPAGDARNEQLRQRIRKAMAGDDDPINRAFDTYRLLHPEVGAAKWRGQIKERAHWGGDPIEVLCTESALLGHLGGRVVDITGWAITEAEAALGNRVVKYRGSEG
jgi:hypothetical protein